MTDLFRVGVITSTHGIKGEVKVFPTTDDPMRFKELETIILDTEKEKLVMEIEQVKFFKQFVILKFKGYDNIDDIEKFRQNSLYVTREQAVPLKEDEFFIADLIGLIVEDEDGNVLGTLKDVLKTGANDVYIVENKDEEILLPAIKQCILKTDLKEKKMTVHIMEGLLE